MTTQIYERRKGDTAKFVKRLRKRMKKEAPNYENVELSYLELDYLLTLASSVVISNILKAEK